MRRFVACGILIASVVALAADSPQPHRDAFAANKALGRGMNLGNALEAPEEGAWGVRVKPEYFTAIKQAGFQTVRLPVKWSAHAESKPPYTLDPQFADRVDRAVDQALANGLNIVVDLHHYSEMDANPDEHLRRLVGLWKQIAARYNDRPVGVYFELLNEPHGKLTNVKWNAAIPQVLAAVRETNPTRPVIVGPETWNAISALDKLELPATDRRLIVTVHYYDPYEFTHQGAPWDRAAVKWKGRKWGGTAEERAAVTKQLERAAAWAKAHDRPIFLGEFGAYHVADAESRARWTAFVAREAERLDFSWAYWEFCSGFGAYDAKTEKWLPGLKTALIPQ